MIFRIDKRKTLKVSCLAFVAILAAAFLFSHERPYQAEASRLSELQSQISAIESQIAEYERQASRLSEQSNSLTATVNRLSVERAAIQAKINLSQARYNELNQQIAITERNIQNSRDALGYVLTEKYLTSNVTLIERLAGSDNLSKFIDKETQTRVVSDSLVNTVEEIRNLRQRLAEQRAGVEQVLAEQRGQEEILAAKKQEQSRLLADTRGQESNFRRLRSQANDQRAALMAEQQRAIQEATGGGNNASGSVGSFRFRNYSGEQGCSGGYPFCSFPYPAWAHGAVDPWGLYQRECTSFAAWRIYHGFNRRIGHFMGQGHAFQWPNTATALMGATANHTPAVGAAAVIPRGPGFPFGHVMVVERVLGDGWVHVSQFNFAVTGEFSTMDVPASSVIFVHFRPR